MKSKAQVLKLWIALLAAKGTSLAVPGTVKLGVKFKAQDAIAENGISCFLEAPKEAHKSASPDIELKDGDEREIDCKRNCKDQH